MVWWLCRPTASHWSHAAANDLGHAGQRGSRAGATGRGGLSGIRSVSTFGVVAGRTSALGSMPESVGDALPESSAVVSTPQWWEHVRQRFRYRGLCRKAPSRQRRFVRVPVEVPFCLAIYCALRQRNPGCGMVVGASGSRSDSWSASPSRFPPTGARSIFAVPRGCYGVSSG